LARKKPVLKVENKTEEDCEGGYGERRRRNHIVEPLDAHLIITDRTIQVKMLPLLDLETFSIFVSISLSPRKK
jgi:hypothetical protein